MARYIPAFRTAVRQKLRDEFKSGVTLEFEEDEIDAQIQLTLEEFSRFVPREVRETAYIHEDSKEIDISSLTSLIEIKQVEYPINQTPMQFIGFKIFADTLILDMSPTSDADHGTLTGTVTFTHASETVTGSGTAFSTELEADDYIRLSSGSRWYQIESVESATSLTLKEDYLGTTVTDTISTTLYAEEPVYLYCLEMHSITESSSSLKPAQEELLIKGVCGQLAANKARDVVDNVNLGGASVAGQLQNWGQNELYAFRRGLNQIITPQQKTEWHSL